MVRKVLTVLAVIAAAVVGLFLLVAAFLPGSYTVERTIEIEKPPSVVFSQVTDYHTWLEWSPWPKLDPDAKHDVTGTPGTPGMTWAWEGEQLGSGSMTIAEVDKDRSLHSTLEFTAPMQSLADDTMILEPTEDGRTRVTWRNTGDLPYPIGRYFGLSVEGMLGPQYEDGLASLKTHCEKLASPSESEETSITES